MRLIFAGTPQIAAEALESLAADHEIVLVITRPDAAQGRKQIITPSAVAQKAQDLGLQTLKANTIRDSELQEIAKANAELAIVVAFGSLIPASALAMLTWWNMHFSLLPKWRGATPLQHSMLHADGVGISIFELEQSLDTGPIIASLPMSFLDAETSGEALTRFTKAGSELILRSLESSAFGEVQEGEPSFAPKLSRSDARVDFRVEASQLVARVNALNPEPMAWAELDGTPLRFLRARSLAPSENATPETARQPGEIYSSENVVILECGDGTRAQLLELQPAGKKSMAAIDWFRGQPGRVQLD